MGNFRLVCLIAAVAGVSILQAQDQPVVKRVRAHPTASIGGKDLYREYCAACHGVDGKGAGPAAPALKVNPTDLTQIARRAGGKFPDSQVLATLKGEAPLPAHGSSDMPVWGSVFNNMSPNPGLTQTRIHSLVNYIEALQAK